MLFRSICFKYPRIPCACTKLWWPREQRSASRKPLCPHNMSMSSRETFEVDRFFRLLFIPLILIFLRPLTFSHFTSPSFSLSIPLSNSQSIYLSLPLSLSIFHLYSFIFRSSFFSHTFFSSLYDTALTFLLFQELYKGLNLKLLRRGTSISKTLI